MLMPRQCKPMNRVSGSNSSVVSGIEPQGCQSGWRGAACRARCGACRTACRSTQAAAIAACASAALSGPAAAACVAAAYYAGNECYNGCC